MNENDGSRDPYFTTGNNIIVEKSPGEKAKFEKFFEGATLI